MTFKQWLKQYEGEDTPRGDLAGDVARDSEFPNSNSHPVIRRYLETRGADYLALVAFDEAWRQYSLCVTS